MNRKNRFNKEMLDNFEIVDNFEILNNLFLSWESNPEFLNSKLYFDYLKYDYMASSEEIEKWKKHLLDEKLKKIYTIEDLDNTLDQMDEINELVKKLDSFIQKIQKNPKQKKELLDNLELDTKGIVFPKKYWFPLLSADYLTQTIQRWIYNIYDISVTIWFHVL
jgi:hypothetical protein